MRRSSATVVLLQLHVHLVDLVLVHVMLVVVVRRR